MSAITCRQMAQKLSVFVALLLFAVHASVNACSLKFTSPHSGDTVFSPTISVSGTGTGSANQGDVGQVTATLNGAVFFQQSGVFTRLIDFLGSGAASVTLKPGANTLNVAGSVSGCSASDSIVVFYDPDRIKTEKNLGQQNICNSTNPINGSTGNKYQLETDYFDYGPFPLIFQRHYNSASYNLGGFGKRWQGTYSEYLTISSNTLRVQRATGVAYQFRLQNNRWVPDADVNFKIEASSNGQWRLTRDDNTVETYSSQGKLLYLQTSSGLTQNLNYDSSGRLAQVADSFGRIIGFYYLSSAADAKIDHIVLPDQSEIYYHYLANGNLSEVVYPDATTLVNNDNPRKSYYYENVLFPGALTGISDENGNRFATWTYDNQGRAISSEHAGGAERMTLSYNADGSTSITDTYNTTRRYDFQTVLSIAKDSGHSQPGGAGCNASASAIGYDTNGNLASRTDFNGNLSCYAYDLNRNLETTRLEGLAPGSSCPANLATYTPAAGSSERKIATQWHTGYRLPIQIDQAGQRITLNYDNSGNPLQKTVTDTATQKSRNWTYTYNSNSQPLSIDGPRIDVNDVTHFAYDTKGNLSTITDALGHVSTITSYNADGQPLALKDANGLVSVFQYDPRGKLISSTAGSEVTHYSYDASQQLIKVTLPDASYLAYSYDNAHRLISIADSLGNHIDYTLDKMGNRLKTDVIDPANNLTSTRAQVFDGLSRLAKTIGAQSQTTNYGYDANGNATSVTDPLNNKTAFAYDPLNRLISSIDPLDKATKSTYDSNDNPLSVTDPLAHNTDYSYDGLGNRLTTNSPDTGQSQDSYDTTGNPLSSVDARGQTVNYSYDALNRITQIRQTDKPPINFTYDQGINGMGHITQMSDGLGTTRWTYDLHGRVTNKTFKSGPLTLATQYGYTADGQLATLTYPSGQVVQLAYNNGQITELDANGSPLLSGIHYQPFGSALDWTFGNGVKTSRDFDLDGLIVTYDLGDRSRQLTYDAAGRINGYKDTDLNHNQSFTYDKLARLTGYSDPATQTSYSYDANGNRTQQLNGVQTKNFGVEASSNRLLTITDANLQILKHYSYDTSGHLISDGNNQFTYDGRGRLIQAYNVSLGLEQYRINGLGQREAKVYGNAPDLSGDANQDGTLTATDLRLIVLMTQGNVPVNLAADCNHDGKITTADALCTQAKIADMFLNPGKYIQAGTYFVYDETGHLLGEYNQSGKPIQETVWLGDMPVAVLVDNNRYFVYADHLNAPRAISDNTGKVIWRWDSEAFGTTAANEDPDNDGKAFTFNLRFPGQYFDKGTGLHYNGFRDYDPSIGRYIQSDPIGLAGGISTYVYVGGNPLSFIDPKGKALNLVTGAIGAAIGGVVGGGGNLIWQLTHGGSCGGNDINWGSVGAWTAGGAATGGLAGLTFGASFVVEAEVGTAAIVGEGAGTTVLGSYPAYVELAQKLGANYFSVPAIKWAQMTAVEQWTLNKAFLDAAIARGNTFLLSNEVTDASSFLAREVQYLIDNGIRFSLH